MSSSVSDAMYMEVSVILDGSGNGETRSLPMLCCGTVGIAYRMGVGTGAVERSDVGIDDAGSSGTLDVKRDGGVGRIVSVFKINTGLVSGCYCGFRGMCCSIKWYYQPWGGEPPTHWTAVLF